MRNFCPNCGKQLGNEKFCSDCGASALGEEKADPSYENRTKKQGRATIPAVIACVFTAAVITAAGFAMLGRSCETLVKKCVTATVEGDMKKLISLMPDSYAEYILEEEFGGDEDEMVSGLAEYFHITLLLRTMEQYNADATDVSYKIMNIENIGEDEIEDIKDEYEDAGLDISDAKKISVNLEAPIDGTDCYLWTLYIDAVKIGNTWYFTEL